MIKIGFIDYFLDEWHANNYPAWIKKEGQGRFSVAAAYGDIDSPDGMKTSEWCEKMGVRPSPSVEELVEASDCIVVLSPDHPEHHLRLSQIPLRSGKPVYIDKTFAPDAATAGALFRLAEEHGTPLYSSSALRYALELETANVDQYRTDKPAAVVTRGPGTYANYAIHQLEMIVKTIGPGAVSAMAVGSTKSPCVVYDYAEDRSAMLHLVGDAFLLSIVKDSGVCVSLSIDGDFWPGFVRDLLAFFESGKPPVPEEETMAAIAMYEAGLKALKTPYARTKV